MNVLKGLLCILLMTAVLSGCKDTDAAKNNGEPSLTTANEKAETADASKDAESDMQMARPIEVQTDDAAPEAMTPETVVVTVNGTPITNAKIIEEVDKRVAVLKERMPEGQTMTETQRQQVRVGVEDMLVQQEVLNQQLAQKDVSVSEEEITAKIEEIAAANDQTMDQVKADIKEYGMTMEDLRSQIRPQVQMQKLAKAYLEDEAMLKEAKAFYDENPSYFQQEEEVKASHILLGKRGITAEEKPAFLEQIKDVQAKLEAGDKTFEELAKEYSTCPSAAQGGDLGFFGRGRMDPAFEKAAFELGVGETSDIVETSFGYHLIKVTDKKEGGMTPFDEAKEQIVSYLIQKNMKENVTIDYHEAEESMRNKVKQQQMMQQQMMQQMQQQIQQQQQQQAAEQAGEQAVEEAAPEAPAEE